MADTHHRTSNDQSSRVRRSTTDCRADLEDPNGNQVHPFDAVESVEFSKEQLERAGRQEIGGSVPADVVDRVELICNLRDGGRDVHGERAVADRARRGRATAGHHLAAGPERAAGAR